MSLLFSKFWGCAGFLQRHPFFSAMLCGVLATATLPPVHAYPLLIPAFSGLFWLLWHAGSARRAFGLGWCFGLGYFVSGLYWFSHALLIEPEKFAWMIPFAVFGLPSILALFYGAVTAISYGLRRYSPWVMLTGFCLLWLVFEVARGTLFTGFPWNLIAYSWAFSGPMSQMAYPLGAYGMSTWTVLLATLPALFWVLSCAAQRQLALALSLALLVLPFGYGMWRLQHYPAALSAQTVHIVQGNISQKLKWNPEKRLETLATYRRLTEQANLPEGSAVIWPETAFPFILEEASPPVIWAADSLPKKGVLITGALHAERSEAAASAFKIYNSLQAVLPGGRVAARYAKTRLVPFGEFVPFRAWLPVEKITHGLQDFSRGAGAQALQVKHLPPFQPLICYEAIYPHYRSSAPVSWLVVVTNDAWFGASAGPYQHLQMNRFRAIERGVPLVRAANSGVSAVFDALGREVARLPLNQRGSLTVKLPIPISQEH